MQWSPLQAAQSRAHSLAPIPARCPHRDSPTPSPWTPWTLHLPDPGCLATLLCLPCAVCPTGPTKSTISCQPCSRAQHGTPPPHSAGSVPLCPHWSAREPGTYLAYMAATLDPGPQAAPELLTASGGGEHWPCPPGPEQSGKTLTAREEGPGPGHGRGVQSLLCQNLGAHSHPG